MSFFGGIRKIFEGLDETAEAVLDVVPNALKKMRIERRKGLSGIYAVRIQMWKGAKFPELLAKVKYNGVCDTHDIDLITCPGQTTDVWGDLSDRDRVHVNREINNFLYNLQKNANADLY